jgi:uncharacterized protein (TIGR00297 family)
LDRPDVIPTLDVTNLVVVVLACTLLAVLTLVFRILDKKGSLLGFVMGLLIGFFGHLNWLLLLLIFLVTGFAATRYKYSLKKKRNVAEGKSGERGFASVLANGWVPMVVAVLSYENGMLDTFQKDVAAVLFLTALSAAASDTIASELGTLSDKVYLITTFKKTRPGINGGVSAIGTMAALAAAIYISLVGWLVIWPTGQLSSFMPIYILIPVVMGFAGCQIDSVLGATLENRGILNKDRVNILSIGAATMLALVMMMLMGA